MSRPLAAITGASSGIGAVFARELAPAHDLLLIARRKDKLDQLAGELHHQYGSAVETIAADLASQPGIEAIAAKLSGANRLELLVNNAGFGTRGYFWEKAFDEQDRMHRLHIGATLRLTHAALPGMVAKNRGAIINVASVASFVRGAGSASYCATKSWMAVFSEALYLDLKASGSRVRVQALCPGFTYSEFHDTAGIDRSKTAPPKMWMTAKEVVNASLRGLERDQLFVIPGWRYRLVVRLVNGLPAGLRLWAESSLTRSRRRELAAAGERDGAHRNPGCPEGEIGH